MFTKSRISLFFLMAVIGFFCWIAYAHAIQTTAQAWPGYTPIVVSVNAAAATAAPSLPAVAGRTTYLEGFDVTGGGATAASVINITTTGLTNNLTYTMNVAAGATASVNAQGGLFIRFPTPIPASAINTAISVSAPTFGAGNTQASVTAYGFYQ